MTANQSPLESLRNKMYVTRASRFNADKRLRREHKLVHLTLAMISAYLIALSAAPTFEVKLLPEGSNYEFLSIVFSAVVLGFSALEIGNDRTREAFFLHQNAMKIDLLMGKISIYGNHTPTDDVASANAEYSMIIAECEFNHCLIDTLWCKIWNSWLGKGERALAFVCWVIFAFWHFGWYILAIVLPVLIPLYLHFMGIDQAVITNTNLTH